MLASASSDPYENPIPQFKCLVTFYTTGYKQCNCFSTGIVSFYAFEVCQRQSNSDAYKASRDSCNLIT